MTDRTQPEALDLADWLEAVGGGPSAKRCAALLREQHARIADLEAQLEAIGAGGVSGPLMGRAMDHFRDATKMMGRWYMVTHDGVATLCEDRRDAEEEAKDADMAWPHSGPHRAVQLVEASTAGFTAADMATASAQGFKDGAASVAASAASEPVASAHRDTLAMLNSGQVRPWDGGARLHPPSKARFDTAYAPLYAAPPTAQAEGWTAEQALRNVLAAVQRYMPPDGPDAKDTLSEIIAIVDPWPLGPLEKS